VTQKKEAAAAAERELFVQGAVICNYPINCFDGNRATDATVHLMPLIARSDIISPNRLRGHIDRE